MNWNIIRGRLKTFSPHHEAYVEAVLGQISAHDQDQLLACAIFGSYARKENRLNSDLDLLLILDVKEGFTQRMARFVEQIELKHESLAQELYEQEGIICEISPYILMRQEALVVHPVYYDLVSHHVIVHDPHGLIRHIVHRVEEYLTKKGAHKETVVTGWLWHVKDAEIPNVLEVAP
ncbi:MAG: nucleotidyltransferase domain-containing protein [Desulfosoma sp.]